MVAKMASDPKEMPIPWALKSAPRTIGLRRSDLIRNAQQAEFFGGGQWREVVSRDGVRTYVTRLWGKEPDALAA